MHRLYACFRAVLVAAPLLGAILIQSVLPSMGSAQETGTIRGTVVQSSTNQPLRDADVFLSGSGRRALTNKSGIFLLTGLPAGEHQIVAELVGFGGIREAVVVRPGETTEVTLSLNEEAVNLPEVIVIASREAQDLSEVAASVGVVDGDAIRRTNPGHPSEIMGQVPGVYVNVTGGEGHMTAIRQPLTTEPVYLFLEDGVPTRSTGFFNHNALYEVNVPQADRIEVMKGPANATYGSDAIGGVINVGTRTPTADVRTELSIEGGEHGFQRYLGSISGTAGANGLRLDGNFTTQDGWRDGTAYDRFSGTLRWDRSLGRGTSMKTVVAYSNIDQNTAGTSALSREDFENSPTLNYTPISFREVTALRISSAFEKRQKSWTFSVTPFGRVNSMDLLPNWSLTFDPAIWETENWSAGVLAKASYQLPNADARITFGFDADYSPGSRKERSIDPTREGLIFTDFTDADPIYDYDVTFRQIAPYVQAEYTPTDRLHLSAGLRADIMEYDYTNNLSVVQTGRHRRPADATPSFSALSPKVGATFNVTSGLDLFASYRQGFRAPSEGQLFRQGSAQNTLGLDPVNVDSWETGLRGQAAGRISYEVSAYWMSKTDDILGFRLPDGNTESVNAGETLHKGLEFGLGLGIIDGLRLDAAYSIAKHTYEDWQPNDELDLSGNEQEFAPNQVGNIRLTVAPPSTPLDLTVEWSRIGPYWMDAANTNEYEGHDLMNIRATFSVTDRIEVFGRLNNVTDERYAERASFSEFRGQELAPGLPRTLYAGVRVR